MLSTLHCACFRAPASAAIRADAASQVAIRHAVGLPISFAGVEAPKGQNARLPAAFSNTPAN